MKLSKIFNWVFTAILLTSCTAQENQEQLQSDKPHGMASLRAIPPLKTITLDENYQKVMGQTVYVPVYSHIFHLL